MSQKRRRIVITCIFVLLIIVTAYFCLFHLGKKERGAFDLLIENADLFSNPGSIRVISGDVYNEKDDMFAFLCVSNENLIGKTTVGYYLFDLDGVEDVSGEETYVRHCKSKSFNTVKVNLRYSLYYKLKHGL